MCYVVSKCLTGKICPKFVLIKNISRKVDLIIYSLINNKSAIPQASPLQYVSTLVYGVKDWKNSRENIVENF